MTRPRPAWPLLATLCAATCGDGLLEAGELPALLARHECAALFACGCPSEWADEDACTTEREDAYGEALSAARAAGLRYDQTCGQAWAEYVRRVGCETPTVLKRDEQLFVLRYLYESCTPFNGELDADDPCDPIGLLGDDCGPRLSCREGPDGPICRPRSPYLPLGADCKGDDTGNPTCEPGLTCIDWGAAGKRCEHARAPGEPCHGPPGTAQCDPDAFLVCDYDTYTCVAAPGAGETCAASTVHCGEDLYCGAGTTCTPVARAGEACTVSDACEVDAYCSEQVCTSWPAAVCDGFTAP